MRLKRLWLSLSLGLLLLFDISCVTIQDQEWCTDLGTLGATCSHTLSDETRDVLPTQWELERQGMLCTEAKNFSYNKMVIEKLCSETPGCRFEKIEDAIK